MTSSSHSTISFSTSFSGEEDPHRNHHHHHRDPSIRHSGRAHIRGKIRRVWRPRYLELVSNQTQIMIFVICTKYGIIIW
ncbi:MAG: hypothetical protein ACI8RD_014555 [Bacillariaceae sp.]|jgi:hypothetical protein